MPRNREEPRLDRSRRLVRVSGAVHRQQDVLVQVLRLIRIADPATEKRHQDRTDVVEQLRIGVRIAALHLDHPLRAATAPLVRILPSAMVREHRKVTTPGSCCLSSITASRDRIWLRGERRVKSGATAHQLSGGSDIA